MRQALFLLFVLTLVLAVPGLASLPETPVDAVTDVYHGVDVVDDYRWLENWDDARVKEWSAGQNGHAREYLDSLPNMDELRTRITEIMETPTASYGSPKWSGENLFVIKNQPPKQQSHQRLSEFHHLQPICQFCVYRFYLRYHR